MIDDGDDDDDDDDEALLEPPRLIVVCDGEAFRLLGLERGESFRPSVRTVDLWRHNDSARAAALSFSLRKLTSRGSGYWHL